jgi:GxxExxY protein
MSLNRAPSSLPYELESLVNTVIGCCLAVHREIGPGMSESVYVRACCAEFQVRGLAYEREKVIPIRYRGEVICHQRIDLLVSEQVVLEVKSVERIHSVHIAQTVGYLRALGRRAGLVVNFNEVLLRQGIRRVVL